MKAQRSARRHADAAVRRAESVVGSFHRAEPLGTESWHVGGPVIVCVARGSIVFMLTLCVFVGGSGARRWVICKEESVQKQRHTRPLTTQHPSYLPS